MSVVKNKALEGRMQNGQPIYFEVNGEKKYGIVIEVLPEKQGVKALIDPLTKEVVTITEPHKVREPEQIVKVLESFGFKVKKPAVKKVAAQPKPKSEAEVKGTFEAALAELDKFDEKNPLTVAHVLNKKELDTADYIRLHGIGFDVAEHLPIIGDETKITPINKMFF